MVEIIKSAPELVQVLHPLAGVAHARAIAHPKRTATIYGTAEPLLRSVSSKCSPGVLGVGHLEEPGRIAEAELERPSYGDSGAASTAKTRSLSDLNRPRQRSIHSLGISQL